MCNGVEWSGKFFDWKEKAKKKKSTTTHLGKSDTRTWKSIILFCVDMECAVFMALNVFVLIFVALYHYNGFTLFPYALSKRKKKKLPYHYPQHLISFNIFFSFSVFVVVVVHSLLLSIASNTFIYKYVQFFFACSQISHAQTSIWSNDYKPHTHNTYIIYAANSHSKLNCHRVIWQNILLAFISQAYYYSIYSIFPERNWFFFYSLFFSRVLFFNIKKNLSSKKWWFRAFSMHIHIKREKNGVSESCGKKNCGYSKTTWKCTCVTVWVVLCYRCIKWLAIFIFFHEKSYYCFFLCSLFVLIVNKEFSTLQ